MLQYVLTESERYSVPELAQMAIEGGCLWIDLCLPELSDEEIRAAIAPDVVDMCREAGVFLTIDDRPELARALGLHGVRLSARFFTERPSDTPLKLREELGPEAVIGVETADVTAVASLVPADVDFVTLPVAFTSDDRERFVERLRATGSQMPVVAQGDFTPGDCAMALADGCNGVAVGRTITDSPDPVEAIRETIDVIQNLG